MDSILKHKDFIATVKYSDEDEAFIGRIEGIDSVVSFEGQSVEELKSAFQAAVENYLEFCHRKGIVDIQKSYTGIFNVRVNSELHRKAAIMAKQSGKTLNSFVGESIERSLKYISN